MSEENELILGMGGLDSFGLGPLFGHILLVEVGIASPVVLMVDVGGHRSSEAHQIEALRDLSSPIVHVEEIVVVGFGGVELLAVVVARHEEHLALEDTLECGVRLEGLAHHLILVMGVHGVVAVGGVSADQAVVEARLGVVVLVDPGLELLEAEFVEVDVGDEADLEPIHFL